MGHTVLLVDDDANLLAGLRRALRNEPYELVTALSAEDALKILHARDVDVVISDENLPGITGTHFLKRVRESFADAVRFMLTGAATLDVAIDAINEAGVSHFFTKPCQTTDMAMAIRMALKQKDLIVAAKQLLFQLRRHEAMMQRLEKQHPGITQFEEDADGAIVIGEPPSDYDELMREIKKHLGG
ncbi:MAG: response regulator [Acidobacteriota bacterium]